MYPTHPKAAQIDAMIRDWKQCKEIAAQLRVDNKAVLGRYLRLGYKRYLITEEERLHLDARRKNFRPTSTSPTRQGAGSSAS